MIQLARRHVFAHGDEVRQLDHLAVAAAHVDVRQVVGVAAIHVGDLQLDVVLLGIAFEARHLAAAEHRFERAADLDDAGADRGDFVAIHVHLQFGLVELQIGVGVHQRGIVGEADEDLRDVLIELLIRFGRLA